MDARHLGADQAKVVAMHHLQGHSHWHHKVSLVRHMRRQIMENVDNTDHLEQDGL